MADNTKKKTRKEEFSENRTSWKFFRRHYDQQREANAIVGAESLQIGISLEILKELQYANDTRK